jgi:hypothetical protein
MFDQNEVSVPSVGAIAVWSGLGDLGADRGTMTINDTSTKPKERAASFDKTAEAPTLASGAAR